MGTSKEGETLKEEDIYNNSEFTGYHKVVSIKDDILVENSGTKTADTTKQITVEVFYKLGEYKNFNLYFKGVENERK